MTAAQTRNSHPRSQIRLTADCQNPSVASSDRNEKHAI
jgi:hypothetical protein